MHAIVGPVAGALVNEIGFRVTAYIGCLMATVGYILTAFMKDITFVIFTFGFITGKYKQYFFKIQIVLE